MCNAPCLPRNFSTRHSDPPNTPVMKAKLRHQYKLLSAVARNVSLTCSRNGACGTSFPAMTWRGGVASDMAPKKTPINNPMTPPPNTPMAALPPQELASHEKSGGIAFGSLSAIRQGVGYGNDCRVSLSRAYRFVVSSLSFSGTGRCSAISAEYLLAEGRCPDMMISKMLSLGICGAGLRPSSKRGWTGASGLFSELFMVRFSSAARLSTTIFWTLWIDVRICSSNTGEGGSGRKSLDLDIFSQLYTSKQRFFRLF